MNTSQSPPGISCLVHSGQVAKQHESSFLYDSCEGRLFRHTPHFMVGNAVVSAYIKDPPQVDQLDINADIQKMLDNF